MKVYHLDSVWGQWIELRGFVDDFYGIREVGVVLIAHEEDVAAPEGGLKG